MAETQTTRKTGNEKKIIGEASNKALTKAGPSTLLLFILYDHRASNTMILYIFVAEDESTT